ncbi:hypothetical protein BCF11_2430 [Collimonas sp. PA-H2]|uniref:hypothetical protein n=1 Tax=Collimonas sp. PA-H2 TaxID=1881062 RepID=UPI000BF5EE3F|nr:hypothetical protein [Collimonas sp. PA-H2]PFH10025.1 hypothetical protein BCF11_2430 [Collimonas sp. PA-H2]
MLPGPRRRSGAVAQCVDQQSKGPAESGQRRPQDRRAAAEHQFGGSLGLGVLTVISAASGFGGLNGRKLLALVITLITQSFVLKRAASQLQSP